jgi:IS4 transposase
MDRGYLDFARLFTFTQNLSTFVTRAKTNFDYRRLYYRQVDRSTGLRCDQTIMLNGYYVSQDYPAVLRRIGYYDIEANKKFIFLTNNFSLDALTIARLYKCRWRIEIFFKWIKQYLRIKTFFGTSINAVKTQIWIAISVYVLAAIVKKELKIELSLGEILQILSIVLFEKVLIGQVLTKTISQNENYRFHNQLLLFNL